MTALPTVARQRNLNQPISEAQPGGQGRPARAERSEPRSGALDGPAKRSYTTPSTSRAATPTDWVEKVRRSIKGSDTPHMTGALRQRAARRSEPIAALERIRMRAVRIAPLAVSAAFALAPARGADRVARRLLMRSTRP
jgi:hypothetical protein